MKNVLITGGSRGIGRQMVLEFSSKGWNTYFLYKNSYEAAVSLERECGALGIKCDVSNEEEVKRAFEIVRRSGRGVDVLVNNAGISLIKPFLDVTTDEWSRMISVTLNGAYYCSRAALGDMLEHKWGRVINISSMWGQVGASCEVAYSAAKAGLIGMTKALALEFAPSGITVNCIAPGIIDTEMNHEVDGEALKDFVSSVPLERMGSPKEIAKTALFLATDDASYITGQVIGVNGGMVT